MRHTPEQRQSRRLPSLPCACATVRRAARAVTRLYDDELRPAGLRATQYTILQALSRKGPVTQRRLGIGLGLDSTTLTRTLRPLERQGLIAVVAGQDRRARLLKLSPEGKRLLGRSQARWDKAQRRLRQALGDEQWKQLWTVLDGVAAASQQA